MRLSDKERSRRYREAHPERHRAAERAWRLANHDKFLARHAVSNAIRAGKLERQPCEVCGQEPAHGHHDDYAHPLAVRWLCPQHHKQHHLEASCA